MFTKIILRGRLPSHKRRNTVLCLRVFSVMYVFVHSLKPSAHALSYLLLRGHYESMLRSDYSKINPFVREPKGRI